MAEHYYRLDASGNPILEPDRDAWWIWMQQHQRLFILEHDLVGGAEVTTIFTGIDKDGAVPPLLYQTEVSNRASGYLDGMTRSYVDRAAALEGHQLVISHLRAQQDNQVNGCHSK